MPKPNQILAGFTGKFWDTEVHLDLIRTSSYNRGVMVVRGGSIDLTKEFCDLLGIVEKDQKSITFTPDFDIDYIQPKNSGSYSIGIQIDAYDVVYVKGSRTDSGKGKALFIVVALEHLLKVIPGFKPGWVQGELTLGVVSGKSFQLNSQKELKDIPGGLFLKARICSGNQCIDFPPSATFALGNTVNSQKTTSSNPGAIHIEKTIGPVQLHKISFQKDQAFLKVSLDVDFHLGPIRLYFLGLGARVNIFTMIKSPFNSMSLLLSGLGISYQKDPLEIAGIFQKTPGKEAYSGGVLIKTKKFAITGFGAYSHEDGYQSVFGFLCLNENIGGNPAFYVTGISMCFGYNRKIVMPSIDQVAQFPLVKYATDTSLAPEFKEKTGTNPFLSFNQNMAPYIPAKKGAFFFGVGVKFNTYKILDSYALLILSEGEGLEFDLLGVSRAALPPHASGRPLVFIEIELRASYSTRQGLLQIQGQLTPQSYIFSEEVSLQGGFAFYTWFKDTGNAQAGDFVLSVGGYHPDFTVPAYYPRVPRVGFDWHIGSSIQVTGKMYMALTPAAIMAGAMFHAQWKKGCISAVFDFDANFLMYWKPFRYEANISINAEVRLTINKWHFHKTYSLGIGADLHVWGPDFSGTAHLHVHVWKIGVSFSISFGHADREFKKISWDEFKESFLPEGVLGNSNTTASQTFIATQIQDGYIEEIDNNGLKTAVVNPKTCQIHLESAIPVTGIEYEKSEGDRHSKLPSLTIEQSSFAIPTTGEADVKSTFYITLTLNGHIIDVLKHFEVQPSYKNMPRAVWNDTSALCGLNDDRTIDMTTGFTLSPKGICQPGHSLALNPGLFTFDRKTNAGKPDTPNEKTPSYAELNISPEWYNTQNFPPGKKQQAEQ